MSLRKTPPLAAAAFLLVAGAWYARRIAFQPRRGGMPSVLATQGPIEDAIEATGSVAPLNRVEIKPPIAGRVEKLLADEGDRVKAGQILAWMSSSDRAAILDAARAQGPQELKRWQDSYKPTPVVSPLSGVVILRDAVVGQTVDPGTVLFAMSDNLIVLAQVDESDIGRVRLGMPARITLDAYPDQPVPGKVLDILYEGKNVSNVITYGVKVRPERVPPFFRSQMTANVGFIAGLKENAVLVPSSAVREDSDGTKSVLVPGPDGKPARREVKTGIESAESVEIVSGLNAGEKLFLAQGRYSPQQAPQSSPLSFGGNRRPGGSDGQAPRPRRSP